MSHTRQMARPTVILPTTAIWHAQLPNIRLWLYPNGRSHIALWSYRHIIYRFQWMFAFFWLASNWNINDDKVNSKCSTPVRQKMNQQWTRWNGVLKGQNWMLNYAPNGAIWAMNTIIFQLVSIPPFIAIRFDIFEHTLTATMWMFHRLRCSTPPGTKPALALEMSRHSTQCKGRRENIMNISHLHLLYTIKRG